MGRINLSSKHVRRASIDITPMIDLVFLLVIFFMVTSSLGRLSSVEVKLPSVSSSSSPVPGDTVVTVTRDNKLYVNDREVSEKELDAYFAEPTRAIQGARVIVRGDRESDYRAIMGVMDTLSRHGVKNFVLAAVR
jgi:biopolymer transport protein ExbD